MRSTATELGGPGRARLEITASDGSPVQVTFDVGREEAREVIRLAERRDVRSGILICQHLPSTRDGRDLYELTRSIQTGHWWTVASLGFPTDRLHPSWVASLNAMDEVWVPGAFNRETFARSGVDRGRIRIVPLRCATLDRPGELGRSYAFESEHAFRFLSVLRLEERKGWKQLLAAYLGAFSKADGVALVLHVVPDPRDKASDDDPAQRAISKIAEAIGDLGRDLGDIPEIVVVTDRLDRAQLADVMAQCQAFVLPSRGEAWCQPMLEALAMGLPVVTTRFGGALAYLHEENAFLVDLDGLADVPDEVIRDLPHFRGHRWAEPSQVSLVRQMRRVRDDRDEVARRTARGVADVAAHWTRERAAARLAARIAAIESSARGAHSADSDATLVRRGTAARGPHPSEAKVGVGALLPCTSRHGPAAPARVLWRAAVYDQSGYASEARAYVKGLYERGFACKVSPLVWSSRVAALDLPDRLLLHELCEAKLADRSVSVQHYFPPQFSRDKAHPFAIGRTMFETDRIPESWVAPCNAMDEIWVPSNQNVESFSSSGVAKEKLVVVPGTFDFTSYAREGPKHPQVPEGRFTFLTVFDWHLRKGWDVLLRAWAEAFAGRDDVQLVMKLQLSNGIPLSTIAKFVPRAMSRFLPRGKSAPPVRLIGKLSESELPALYRSADVFVLPTRGEGYGRPFVEAMAVGVPAIGTGWSGQVDFMDEANSWLIESHLVLVSEEALQEVPSFRGHRWAEPHAGHLAKLMREARESPEAVAAKGARAAQDVRAKLAPDRVIGIIRSRLEHWLSKL